MAEDGELDRIKRHERMADSINVASFANANFPVNPEGRTLHLGTKRGEVANRILSVGSMDRAVLIAKMLEPPAPGLPLFEHLSSRGFYTVTGRYRGVPVSIVTTMMGMPNMDFVVRECRAVVDGQMAVVRLGTCGALRPPASLGSLVVASAGAVCVRRDPDAYTRADGRPHYIVSAPVRPDEELSALVVAAAREAAGGSAVLEGLNATADSFYSSQGRLGDDFEDFNADLLEQLRAQHEDLLSLEMETFTLMDLARCSRGSVRAAAFAIVLAERYSNRFIDHAVMRTLECKGGAAALGALSCIKLDQDVSLLNGESGIEPPPEGYVWAPRACAMAAAGRLRAPLGVKAARVSGVRSEPQGQALSSAEGEAGVREQGAQQEEVWQRQVDALGEEQRPAVVSA